MPSSESITAGLLGSYLLDATPFWPIASRLAGLIGIIWMAVGMLVLGQNSLGQVIVGVLMGIILYFYSTRSPQFMIFFDAVVESVAAIILIRLDGGRYDRGDPNNLNSWLMWGLAFETFTCAMMVRHYKSYDTMSHLKHSLHFINNEIYKSKSRNVNDEDTDNTEFDTILDDEALVETSFTKISDILFTLPLLVIMIVLLLLANCIQEYGWLS